MHSDVHIRLLPSLHSKKKKNGFAFGTQQNSGGDAALGREVLSESQDFWSHGSRPKFGSLATKPSEVGPLVAVAGCSHHASCCCSMLHPAASDSRHALVCLTATRWWAVYDGIRGGRNRLDGWKGPDMEQVCTRKRNMLSWLFVVPADVDGMWVKIASADTWKNQPACASSLVPQQGMRNIDMYKDTFPTFAWWKHMLPLTFLQTEMLLVE